ncbi:hypothetical protein GW17_00024968 [Ensete ventricosum]|nr:hypothetical protein GW17_00024968 [Ensete ventricosum]
MLPPSVSSSTALDSSTAIDVDNFSSSDDIELPTVEEMEEMDNCDLKEVEMEDIVAETAPDIDSCDSNNPLAVVEYVEDIYNFYRQTEVAGCASPQYMSHQFDINEKMRAILIDWLIELCLVEYKMLKFRPSLLAAAAIYTAQCCLRGFKYWTKTSEVHTAYPEEQLL